MHQQALPTQPGRFLVRSRPRWMMITPRFAAKLSYVSTRLHLTSDEPDGNGNLRVWCAVINCWTGNC